MTKDLVCGMDVDQSRAKATADYNGQTYYFCSDHCKERFESNPHQYITKTA